MSTENAPAQPDTNTPEGRGQAMASFVLNTPERVPAKFKRADGSIDVDGLAASYAELERRQSGAPAQPAADAPAPTQDLSSLGSDESTENTPPSTSDILGSLDNALGTAEPKVPDLKEAWETAKAEIAAGKLSEEARKRLLDGGVPAEIISDAEAASSRRTEELKAKAVEIAGSAKDLQATLDWAKANLPLDQRQAMVTALQGPNAETLLSGLVQRARLAGALGEQGYLQSADGGPPPSDNARVRAFTDAREMQAAIADSRYQTDPEYRKTVMKRMMVTRGQDPARLDASNIN